MQETINFKQAGIEKLYQISSLFVKMIIPDPKDQNVRLQLLKAKIYNNSTSSWKYY